MRIGILTFHRAFNCGAMLQAWALKTVLERMGHVVEFPACNRVGVRPRFTKFPKRPTVWRTLRAWVGWVLVNGGSLGGEDLARARYRRFRTRFLPERACGPQTFARHYDCLVVGSDQVWNPYCAWDDTPLFLGEGYDFPGGLVAYAVSCGDRLFAEDDCARLRAAAARFKAVSVREQLVAQVLGAAWAQRVRVVPDPTLLLTAQDYQAIATPLKRGRRGVLYVYTLDAQEFVLDTAQELARRLGKRCVITPVYQYSRYGAPRGLTYGISPDRLVGQVQRADVVLAASFHGTVFAMLFGKPFLSLRCQEDTQESRPASLLRQVGLMERLVTPKTSLDVMEALLRKPLPADLDARIDALRRSGLDFLTSAISPPLRATYNKRWARFVRPAAPDIREAA